MSSNPEKRPIELHTSGDEVVLSVRVQPKASRDQIRVEPDGRVRITLTTSPVDGAANKALCAHVAKHLGIAKGAVRVIRGHKSRDKTIGIRGVTAEAVRESFAGTQ